MPTYKRMTLGEALEKGYKVVGADVVRRTAPPTIGEQTALALTEIAPAIAGGILGGFAGPKGAMAGGGGGAALGNIWSQNLRQKWGLQEGFNPGELAAGTAAAMVPVGKLLQYGTAARIATRTGQGVLLSEAELAGRTILDEGRLPSEQEAKMAALFGGVIGGGMGAIEAKWFNKHIGAGKEGDTRDELANQLALEIKNRGPVAYLESHPVAKELLGTKEPFTLKYPIVPSDLKPEDLAFEILDATEENILRVANATPVANLPPVQPALAGRETPLLEYGGLAKQNIERVKQQKQLSQEVFLPDVDYEKIHHTLREELHEALFEWEKWKARPPRKRGKKEGARFKKNLEAAKKKVLQAHRNRLKSLGLDPDLEAKMRARQLPSLDQPVEAMPKVDRPMRQASEKLNKYDQMAEDYYGMSLDKISRQTIADLPKAKHIPEGLELASSFKKHLGVGGFPSLWKFLGFTDDHIKSGRWPEPRRITARDALKAIIKIQDDEIPLYQREYVDQAKLGEGVKYIDPTVGYQNIENVRDLADVLLEKANPIELDSILFGPQTKIERAFSEYTYSTNDIRISTLGGVNPNTFIHEILHGLTSRKLDDLDVHIDTGVDKYTFLRKGGTIEEWARDSYKPETIARMRAGSNASPYEVLKETLKIYERLLNTDSIPVEKKELLAVLFGGSKHYLDEASNVFPLAHRTLKDKPYGLLNVHELIAEGGGANPGFQRLLHEQSPDELNITKLSEPDDFVEAAALAIGEDLTKVEKNLLGKVVKASSKIIDSPPAEGYSSKLVKDLTDEELREKWFRMLVGGALPAGSMAAYLSDEDGDMSKASLLHLIGIGALGLLGVKGVQALRRRPGFPSYGKTKASQKVKPKDTPRAVQADKIKGSAADDGAYHPPNKLEKLWGGVSDFTSHTLSLLSRRAKKIHPQIAAALRKPFLDINKDVKEYKKRALPFFLELQKKIKSPKDQKLLMRYFLNANTGGMEKLRDLAKTYKVSLKKLVETRDVLQELRTRLREEAGVDLGKIENYMPRAIGDYRSFQRFLDESPLLRDQKNEVDKALADYAQKQKYDGVEAIPEAEAAVVTARVLEGDYPGLAQSAGNEMSRKIVEVNDQMLAAYLKPVESIERYIDTMVRHLHYRKALGRGLLKTQTKEIKGEGFRDVFQNDLGIAAKVDDTIAQKVSIALAEEHGFAGQQAKIDELRKIIQATFDPTQVPSLIQGIKTATYLQTLTNLGSTITQFGEVAYSMHFYGLSNTFRSAYRNKFNRDFYSDLGLNRHDADMATTAEGMQGVLDKLFDWMQFSRMDKWAKNTTMNAAWKKLHQRSRKDSVNLKAELTLKFGDEKATRMLRDLQEIKPSMTAKLTEDLEEVIFNEISDLSPITRMEQAAAHRGKASIFYTLRSFGLKQIDIYREAAGEHILEARRLYSQGDHKAAANEAFKGVKALTSLGVLFAAANASTDVVKDAIYGRPIKTDDLVWDNIMKLFLVNRYFKYKYQREGLGKALLELIMPATPVFDRAGKDIADMVTFQDFKGHTLQGTPFDLAYWWWLGGRDKIEKQYGK